MSNAIDDYINELERQQEEQRRAEENRQQQLKIQLDIESEERRQREIKKQEWEREKAEQAKRQAQEEARKRAEEQRQYRIKYRWRYIDTYHEEHKKELTTLKNNFIQSPDLLKKLVDIETKKLSEKINALPIANYNPAHLNIDIMELATRKYIQQKIFNKDSLINK